MSDLVAELRALYEELIETHNLLENSNIQTPLKLLEASANEVGKAWSGSWLGYQSRVYYAELKPPPPGSHFSSEWGFASYGDTSGDWQEYPQDAVETAISKQVGNPDLAEALEKSDEARRLLEQRRDDLVSILRTAADKYKDQYLEKLAEEVGKTKAFTGSEYVECIRPSRQWASSDSLAISQGLWIPPHISILAKIFGIRSPITTCETLAKAARQAFSHIERIERNHAKAERIGTNVFIGHGRSKEWRELKDFIHDRMHLPWDEFNRVPVAGIPNTVRLSTMLDAAAIAFLVLTGEDERTDGSLQARLNVIHESGLFQGRLGFSRAIVMLEEGCEEFSNIEGLGQLRFPKGNIKAAFHDVQLVLEREGLITPPE